MLDPRSATSRVMAGISTFYPPRFCPKLYHYYNYYSTYRSYTLQLIYTYAYGISEER